MDQLGNAPRWAWHDTKEWLLDRHIAAWVLTALIPVGGALLAALLIPPDTSTKIAAMCGFAGGVAGLVLLFASVYAFQLILAFKALLIKFTFEFDNSSRVTQNAINEGSLFLGVSFSSSAAVTVQLLYLEVDGKRARPTNWTQSRLENRHRDNYEFKHREVAAMLTGEKKNAQFVAIVNGHERKSPPFDLNRQTLRLA